jgi:hypothetical protein
MTFDLGQRQAAINADLARRIGALERAGVGAAAPFRASRDDGLAARVAELEERLARLEGSSG